MEREPEQPTPSPQPATPPPPPFDPDVDLIGDMHRGEKNVDPRQFEPDTNRVRGK